MKRRTAKRVELFQTATCQGLVARFGANVRRLREARGWTQEEAAFQAREFDPALLRTIEAGTANLTITTIARLCDGFGVDVLDLFAPAPPIVKRPRGRPRKVAAPDAEATESGAESERDPTDG